MESSQYSAVRPAGREHIPVYPDGFVAVRIVQLVVGVVILGLGAFGVSVLAFDGDNFIVAVVSLSPGKDPPAGRVQGSPKTPLSPGHL